MDTRTYISESAAEIICPLLKYNALEILIVTSRALSFLGANWSHCMIRLKLNVDQFYPG